MDEPTAGLTCVVAFGSRVFAGDANGFVRCYAATSGLGGLVSGGGGGGGGESENGNESDSRETERGSSSTTAPADGSAEVPLSTPEWVARAAQGAILSLCVIQDPRATSSRVTALKNANENDDENAAARRSENLLLVVGAASGELVFFRNETEARRVQLESAVLQICAHGSEAEFLAGDLRGTLYGVNQYGVLWKERLGQESDVQDASALSSQGDESNGGAFFYPPTVQPMCKAIASISVPDIENTLSSYVLLSTGQRHLIVTHQGKAFAYIPTSSPVSTVASFLPGASKEQEDVILFAGEAGCETNCLLFYYAHEQQGVSDLDISRAKFPVSFSIVKILHIGNASSDGEDGANSKCDSFTWVCLGLNGQVALFCGKNLTREWNATISSLSSSSNSSSFPVDAAVISSRSSTSANLAKKESKMVAIAFPDRVQLFAVGS